MGSALMSKGRDHGESGESKDSVSRLREWKYFYDSRPAPSTWKSIENKKKAPGKVRLDKEGFSFWLKAFQATSIHNNSTFQKAVYQFLCHSPAS